MMITSQSQVACPRCGKDDQVRKVSVVAAQNTGIGTSYSVEGNVPQNFVSNLGVKLATPRKSSSCIIWVIFLLGLVIFGGLFCAFVGAGVFFLSTNATAPFTAISLIIGVMLLGIFFGLTLLLWMRSDAKATAAQQKAFAKWDQLYYCMRDDLVFVPGTTVSMPSDAVQKYIWS